jgi:hypothetical protein
MQYRLSTIFLVFFVTATSLALFEAWGLWIAFVVCIAALVFNKAKTVDRGIGSSFFIIMVAIVCPGFLIAVIEPGKREAARRANCCNNLRQIGLGLHNYHDIHKHFPPLNILDEDGKPLYSWMVQILPHMEYDNIYEQLHKDEPWNSNHNAGILGKFFPYEFACPSADRLSKDFSSNYVAIVGPGTMWRKEGTVMIKDLANTSLTVMAVECVTFKKHWAEPCTLTAEEILKNMETQTGTTISSNHSAYIEVLFADGSVRTVPSHVPISFWQKLLMGEIKDQSEMEYWLDYPGTPTPQFGPWANWLSFVIWIFSILLLFRRAWTSRPKAETPKASAA